MRPLKNLIATALVLLIGGTNAANAQNNTQEEFGSTTQILETSILFAIGAREAEQALRGSFGWPTFQEGFVDRVYFRFDPDGYARFSSSPRLDEDVFEVICVEGSTACIGQKDNLQIGLTSAGQIQLILQGATPQDRFFVADESTELPLPPSILEPLEPRLESLLAAGGQLLIKREQELINSISLTGFSPVITYLRWVANNQDSRVFPRGWPVPAGALATQTSALTQPGEWLSPTPQPQSVQTTFQTQQRANGNTVIDQNETYQRNLRDLNLQDETTIQGNGAFGVASSRATLTDNPNTVLPQSQSDLQSMQQMIEQMRAELQTLRNGSNVIPNPDPRAALVNAQTQAQSPILSKTIQAGPAYAPDLTLAQVQMQNGAMGTQEAGAKTSHSIHEVNHAITSLMNRMVQVETRIVELEIKLADQLQRQHSDLVALETAAMPDSSSRFEESSTETDQKTEMSALEKLLLDQLGEVENITDEQLAKLESTSASQATPRMNQDDLIRQLLDQLSSAEVGDVSANQNIDQAENLAAESDPEISDASNDDSGFVTLSDYINTILKQQNGASNSQ